MKVKNYLTIVLALMVCVGAAYGESESASERGYIGIRMDARPLPELLTKHLRLSEDQGVRIQNVGVGSPADKAGLERDDIIIALNGKDVTDNEEFARAVQKAGAGAEVSLEVIHLGERKTVKLKLASFTDDFEAKYPAEPELVESWQPGRMFRLQPDAENWIQVMPDGSMQGGGGFGIGGWGGGGTIDKEVDQLLKEVRTYHYSTDGEDYSVTIEGNPNDDDAKVVVRIGGEEHTTTVGKIDKLPKKYQEAAEEALKGARKSVKTRVQKWEGGRPMLPKAPDVQIWRDFEKRGDLPGQFQTPQLGPGQDMFDRIEKQMRQLQERIEQLEKERGGKSGGSPDKDKPKEPKKPLEPRGSDAVKI